MIIILFFILFLVQDPLGQYIGLLSYVDEFFTILCWVLLLLKIVGASSGVIRVRKWTFKIFCCVVLMLLLGIGGNFIWHYQSLKYITVDVLSYSKFFAGLALGLTLGEKSKEEWIQKKTVIICKCIAVIQFLLAVHEELFYPWFDYLRDGKILRSLKLYYSNQTYFVSYSVFLMALLLLLNAEDKFNKFYIFMLVVSVSLSMRSKAWGFLVVFGLVALVTKNIRIRHPFLFAGACIPLVVYVVREKLVLYFFTSSHYSPRRIILEDGIALAQKYFPVGAGFGTFCSPGAALGGSPVYNMLGTNYSVNYIAAAINDMYWGHLLGQYGFLGTIAMAAVLIILFCQIWKLQKRNRPQFLSACCLFIYIVIASFGESPFFAPYIIGFSFVLGLILAEKGNRKDEKDIIVKQYVPLKGNAALWSVCSKL